MTVEALRHPSDAEPHPTITASAGDLQAAILAMPCNIGQMRWHITADRHGLAAAVQSQNGHRAMICSDLEVRAYSAHVDRKGQRAWTAIRFPSEWSFRERQTWAARFFAALVERRLCFMTAEADRDLGRPSRQTL